MTNFSNVLTINFKTIVLKSIFQPPPSAGKKQTLFCLPSPTPSPIKIKKIIKNKKVDNAYFKRNLLTSIEFEFLQFLSIKTKIPEIYKSQNVIILKQQCVHMELQLSECIGIILFKIIIY